MQNFIITLCIGIVIGIIDVIPMIKMKLDKYDILSAFVFYLIVPFVVLNIDIAGLTWWIKGGLFTFLLSLPIQILVYKTDKNAVRIMSVASIILGSLIGVAGHILL